MKFFENKWPAVLLWPFSILYGVVMHFRNFCYDKGLIKSYAVDCKVISVGNITIGGSGKTPTVQYIFEKLSSLGKRVAVISRGYGRSTKGGLLVSDGRTILSTSEEAGDEPYLLAKSCFGAIVAVDEDRVRMARKIVEQFSPHVIILDDAFQHRRIRRDLDIVMIRSGKPFGNGFMLPAGPLREPLKNLRRAHLILVNGENDPVKEEMAKERIPVVNIRYKVHEIRNKNGRFPAETLFAKDVVAFCGIANPKSFLQTLDEFSVNILDFATFQDHHQYTTTELLQLRSRSKRLASNYIVTTEKDWVKLPKDELDEDWLYLRIRIVPENEENLVSRFEMLF